VTLLKINGVDIPTPSDYQVGIQDLSNAERNAKGDMIIERIATKRKLELKWNFLTQTELNTLLGLVSGVFFTVNYIDPVEGSTSGTFYCGDRTVQAVDYRNGVMRWKDISFSLVEK
jgi:hypothetical protein